MLVFLLKRIGAIIPIVFGVATLSFFLMKLTPGDPALMVLGEKASADAVERLRESWGLNEPLLVQYVKFLGGLVVGDLGVSYTYQVPVVSLLATRLPATVALMVVSLVFAVVISVPLALWVAVSKSAAAAVVVRLFNAVVQGMPTFFVGSLLISFLALRTGLFPVGGYGSDPISQLHSLVLPGLAVALSLTPMLVRSLVASLSEKLDAEFVSFAMSKGLPRRAVVGEYALRNSAISAVTILGIQAGGLVGGTLVVENVFAIPGLGSLLMQAVLSRDFVVVQALTVCFGIMVVIVYAITDIVYGQLDPRARVDGSAR